MNRPLLLTERRLFAVFALLLVALLALSLWQWRNGAPLSASLLDILPHEPESALIEHAQQLSQQALDRELVVLISHPQAGSRLDGWADQLRQSGHFSQVQDRIDTDLAALASDLLAARSSLAPLELRQQLATYPQDYFSRRAAQIVDPLGGFSLVSAQQDWLGLIPAIQQQLQGNSPINIDLDGRLLIEAEGQTWYLLRLNSREGGFSGKGALAAAASLDQLTQHIHAEGGQVLASGSLLFAARAQQQAETEISWLGGLSLLGSLLLIVGLFRRLGSLLAVLPALFGLWLGVTACIAVFGQIHVLTLVLGVSLIGVTIDFPMHYLSKGWVMQPWNAMAVLRATLPGLTLGMLANLIGYSALAFTPFVALTQVAVFSVAGLLGAYLCTLTALPWLLRRSRSLQPWPLPLGWMQRLLDWHARFVARINSRILLLIVMLFALGGLLRIEQHDDLRQWIVPDAQLLEQARRIGELTGQQPTSQFFLVQGADEAQLLERLFSLERELDTQVMAGALTGYQSLGQLLAGRAGEPSLNQVLAALQPEDFAPLLELGVPEALIAEELLQLQQQPQQSLDALLHSRLGEPWRMLWLGEYQGARVGMVRLQGLGDSAALAVLADPAGGILWVDQPARLNRLFASTQRHALWAKVLASGAIFILLAVFLGWRGALRTLTVSLASAVLAAATLGWLGLPLTLFSIFGLLLVTAIGVDYAIIMYEGVGGAATSLLGAFLAAVTTWLSFGLLALSATPAVSSFGLAVSLGLVFCFLLAPWAKRIPA